MNVIQQVIRRGFFLVLLVLVTLAFFSLIRDFLMTCFWAAVLAIIFRNPYRRMRIGLNGRSNLAAFLTTIIILVVVVLPLFLITLALVRESLHFYESIQSGRIDIGKVVDFFEAQIPQAEEFLARFGVSTGELRQQLSNAALAITQTIANRLLSYTQDIITFTIQFFLMLYLLFFFLRDGQRLLNTVINTLPMGNRRERILMQRFAVVARATLKGTMIVAIIQGAIGGVLFSILGIQGAVFWGVLMTLLSLLPVGGSGLVWGPTAIILFVQGEIAKAVILVIVGGLIIGLVDNLLRPILVGRDTQMPDFLVLLATIGGLTWFGLSGFILGPVIAALFITCWEIMGREYGGDKA